MVKEIGWYLESGRFSNMAEELEASLRNYEEARKTGRDEEDIERLRENARILFEDNCVRSGLRDSDESFINIDAEFFSGNTLDEPALNAEPYQFFLPDGMANNEIVSYVKDFNDSLQKVVSDLTQQYLSGDKK